MSRPTTLPARARRPQIFHTVLLAGLVAACQFGPSASPAPTDRPGSGNPSSPPTSAPAPTPVPASPTPTFGSDQVEHPTGATDVVLRMEEGGGFVPIEWNLTNAPQFTLYGDGTVVFRPLEDPERMSFEQGLPRFLTGRMTEEGIQALLVFALDTGRLANARERYEDMMIADASTTTFILNAAGAEKVVSVYALSEGMEPGPDAADRQGFLELKELLMNFEPEARSGTLDEVSLYDPEWYRVTMLEAVGEPVAEPIAWPWDDLTPEDFPIGEDELGGVRLMTREEVGQLTEVPSGGQLSIWVETPDGTLVSFAVRPLLPDEIEAIEAF